MSMMPPTPADIDRWGTAALWRGDAHELRSDEEDEAGVDDLTRGMALSGVREGVPGSSTGAPAASHGAGDPEGAAVENLAGAMARSHIGEVAKRGVEDAQGGAKRRRTDPAAEEWRKFTPSDSEIDPTKCMARTWGAHGSGGQCGRLPEAGSRFCAMHTKKEGQRGWHGAVDGAIPAQKLAEFQRKGRPRDVGVDMAVGTSARVSGAGSAGDES